MVLVAPDILNEVRQLPWYFLATGLARRPAALAVRRPRPSLLARPFARRWPAACSASVSAPPMTCSRSSPACSWPSRPGRWPCRCRASLLFVAGGAACVALAHAVAPSWDEPAVCFLVGGLLGVLLYKVWVTALSSLAGTLLIAYSILGLLHQLAVCDAVAWADEQTPVQLGLRSVRGAGPAGAVPAGTSATAPAAREGDGPERG